MAQVKAVSGKSNVAGSNDAAFTDSIKSLIDANNFAQVLQKLQKKADPRYRYVEAYCQYRNSKFDDALRLLDTIPIKLRTPAVEELQAQTFYRLGRYQEALSAYMQLFDDPASADDFQPERICNTLCVLTKLHEEDIPNVPEFALPPSVKRYEVEFNAAALDISKGHFTKAHQRLAKALELYKVEAKVQQIPADEVAGEVAMLERQRDFALSIASVKAAPATPVSAPSGKAKTKKADAPKIAASSPAADVSSSSVTTASDLDSLENNFWGQFVALKRKATAKNVALPPSKTVKASGGTAAENADAKKKKKKKSGATASPAAARGGKLSATVGGAGQVGIKKKKRKPRLPKNYDPNVVPDPERWLPLHERSYYRGKKRKDKQSAIGKGTQGAVATQGDPVTSVQSHYSPVTVPSQTAGPRQQQGPAGGRKKSGAGRRGGKK